MTLEKESYQSFIYQLSNLYPSIKFSTLKSYHIDKWTAIVKGELLFDKNITLRVREVIDFNEKQSKAIATMFLEEMKKFIGTILFLIHTFQNSP